MSEPIPGVDYDQDIQKVIATEIDGVTTYTFEDKTEQDILQARGVTQVQLLERLGATKFETLLGLLDSLPKEAKWSWEYSPTIRLHHPLIVATKETLKSALELTEEEFTTLLTP